MSQTLATRGILPSIGHSEASYEQAEAAILAGARHVTHLYDAINGYRENPREALVMMPGVETAAYRLKFDNATLAPQVQLTDQDMQAYFDTNRDTFREPEQVRIEYVLFSADTFAGQVQVSDAEVKAYYDEHAAEYEMPEEVHARHILFRLAPEPTAEEKAKVRARAEEVLAQVKAGGDFAALAKQYSEDASAAQGAA